MPSARADEFRRVATRLGFQWVLVHDTFLPHGREQSCAKMFMYSPEP